MVDEKLEEIKSEFNDDDSRKNIIKAVILILVVIILFLIFFVVKGKIDYSKNEKNLDKYARDYYKENMQGVNVASGYVINLRMLEESEKYDLKYFSDCDKRETNVDLYVDDKGKIIDTKVHIKCK